MPKMIFGFFFSIKKAIFIIKYLSACLGELTPFLSILLRSENSSKNNYYIIWRVDAQRLKRYMKMICPFTINNKLIAILDKNVEFY